MAYYRSHLDTIREMTSSLQTVAGVFENYTKRKVDEQSIEVAERLANGEDPNTVQQEGGYLPGAVWKGIGAWTSRESANAQMDIDKIRAENAKMSSWHQERFKEVNRALSEASAGREGEGVKILFDSYNNFWPDGRRAIPEEILDAEGKGTGKFNITIEKPRGLEGDYGDSGSLWQVDDVIKGDDGNGIDFTRALKVVTDLQGGEATPYFKAAIEAREKRKTDLSSAWFRGQGMMNEAGETVYKTIGPDPANGGVKDIYFNIATQQQMTPEQIQEQGFRPYEEIRKAHIDKYQDEINEMNRILKEAQVGKLSTEKKEEFVKHLEKITPIDAGDTDYVRNMEFTKAVGSTYMLMADKPEDSQAAFEVYPLVMERSAGIPPEVSAKSLSRIISSDMEYAIRLRKEGKSYQEIKEAFQAKDNDIRANEEALAKVRAKAAAAKSTGVGLQEDEIDQNLDAKQGKLRQIDSGTPPPNAGTPVTRPDDPAYANQSQEYLQPTLGLGGAGDFTIRKPPQAPVAPPAAGIQEVPPTVGTDQFGDRLTPSSKQSGRNVPQATSGSQPIDDNIISRVKQNEGLELKPYKDGDKWAIGYGQNLTDAEAKKYADGISKAKAEELLQMSLAKAQEDVASLPSEVLDNLSENQRGVLVEMAYQMGGKGLRAFNKTLKLVAAGDTKGAAKEMLRSKWALKDSPKRAERLAEIFAELLEG